ncbi:DUF4160 domain-containing protein [Cyanobacteria bacterium FACHB-63]|nr:DUF4160 domain-containing protein [Cyanobacteria bacterium FACHB-63]
MPTIIREDGFRVVIYLDDHLPSHVHVINAESEVKINLGNDTELPTVIEYRGKRSVAIKALKLVISYRSELLEAWRDIHGEP